MIQAKRLPRASRSQALFFPGAPVVQARLTDWRWPVPVSAGMPQELRDLVERTKRVTGWSMAEIVRRSLALGLARQKEG